MQKFIGKETELGDEFVYQHTAGRDASDQYTRTTEEIIRYSSSKYKYGGDVERSLADGTLLVVPAPSAPIGVGTPPVVSETDMVTWKLKMQMALQRSATLETNMESVYGLIRGQCSKPILEKVEAQQTYSQVHSARDPIRLLGLIQNVMFNYNSKQYRAMSIINIIKSDIVTQTRYMTASEYLEKFRTQLDVLKAAGGDLCDHPGMVTDELTSAGVTSSPTGTETADATSKARGRFEGALFMMKSNQAQYGRLLQELANDYNKGHDSYPTTLTAAYELMLHDVRDQDSKPQAHGNGGLAFNTIGTSVPASNTQANPRPDITCNRCGKTGHFGNKCEEITHATGTTLTTQATSGADVTGDVAMTILGGHLDDEEGFQFLNHGKLDDGALLSQHKKATGQTVPRTWILLDNQSTVDVFYEESLLRNIREAPTACRISCNAGVVTTNRIGDLPGYPRPVWYHPDGIANILSLKRVSEHCRVQYDSASDGGAFRVTKPDGTTREFKPSLSGLHYCDTAEHETVLVNTVAQKKEKYTERAYQQAVLARRLQDIIGRPTTRDYVKIVEGGMLHNCPITRADILAAEDIFGPNLGSLKGKTVRTKQDHVRSLVADVPYHIIKTHKAVTLCFDIMFVNKIAFLVTVSRNLRFGTTERLASRQATVVGKGLVNVIKMYRLRGFNVIECRGDGEFKPLVGTLADARTQLNTTAEDEHVPEVERYIRTLKERTRSTYNVLPFKKLPGMMIVEMVHSSNYWLNMFPANDGVSSTQSPRRIMTGQSSDYGLHCKLQFGEYVQVHESHDNSMKARTTGGIALRPTGNVQGGYYFMSLSTGKRLNRYKWTPLPMPIEVIERVHAIAQKNPAGGAIEFGWRDGTEIADQLDDEDDLHDEDYMPGEETDDDESSDSEEDMDPPSDAEDDDDPPSDDEDAAPSDSEDYSSDDDEEGPNQPPPLIPRSQAEDSDSDSDDEDDEDDVDDEDDASTPKPDKALDTASNNDAAPVAKATYAEVLTGDSPAKAGVPPPAEGTDETPTEEGVDVPALMDTKYGARGRPGLRERKAPRSSAAIKEPQSLVHRTLSCMLSDELNGMGGFSELEYVALTQYNLKQGLKIYGEAAAEAVLKEMKQLHDRKTIQPRYAHQLTLEHKRKALAYLMFIKEKRCGLIKGRGCADGRKQKLYKTKEESSSPTVCTEALMLSCAIDAKERRRVMTCDVPGAFMQADIDELVHVRLTGPLAELLAKVDPDLYRKFMTTEGGKPVLYVELRKALYGTVSAALLFWKDLSGYLTEEGFTANPYDSCVMNKTINGKQCTILWHVDDLKISHVEQSVLEEVLARLNLRYGKETPLTVTRGDLHEYLGMTIDYSVDGKVAIRMDDYVANLLDETPEDMEGSASTPAAEHLFQVDADAQPLDTHGADQFHSLTAKLLFLGKRARPDIQTPIAFLCTRVSKPDTDDYKKLTRVVRYLRGTPTLCLTLEADDLQVIWWWVDASFGVHTDMRSHTGATMSLGKGAVYSTSTRQKLNTKSSTEAELVGVDDAMPIILWTRQFMEGQGYTVKDNIVYQDNQSSMLLEKNGQMSSSKRTRHINIRYFFVTDRVRGKQLSIEYCPTGDMWADVFTKPLQGAAFAKFRQLILNT